MLASELEGNTDLTTHAKLGFSGYKIHVFVGFYDNFYPVTVD